MAAALLPTPDEQRQGPPSVRPASPLQPLPGHTYRVLLADVAHELHEAHGDALLIHGLPLGDTCPLPSWVPPLLVGCFLALKQATDKPSQSQAHRQHRSTWVAKPTLTGRNWGDRTLPK